MSLQTTLDRTVPNRLQQGWRILTSPVWNHDSKRLRAPLRALLPLVMTFLAFGVVVTVVRGRFEHPLREVLEFSLMAVVLVAAVLIGARLFDRRPAAEYGLALDSEWLRSFAVGGFIGIVINAGTLLTAIAVGWATVTGFFQGSDSLPFLSAMLLVLAYTGVLASWEEFIFRGAMLKNLAEGADGYVPRWVAVGIALLISTGIFAFMHSGKVTGPGGYSYYLLAGLIFGCVYVLTGDLALPMGFHVFYNFSMSAVFGLGVSQRTPEVFVLNVSGPTVWIGEEGVLRMLFAAVGGLLLVGYIRWRDGSLDIDHRITQWTPRAENSVGGREAGAENTHSQTDQE
ncbi:CPBP family intramembrane metalloprotease domain-containing protein [Halorubrum sp. Ea8]|nr:CPBP family intramembrane metalloprotease domain-containing protein [Halorubrum sp. Ea8]